MQGTVCDFSWACSNLHTLLLFKTAYKMKKYCVCYDREMGKKQYDVRVSCIYVWWW